MTEREGIDRTACPPGEETVAWVQGELDPRERAAITEHLEHCASCRGLAADAEQILGSVASVGEPEPEWVESIATPAGVERAGSMRKAPRLALLKVLAVAAAAVLAIVTWPPRVDVGAAAGPAPGTASGTASGSAAGAARSASTRGAPSPLAWVESHLGADGTWYAFSRSGPRAQEVGMHAFGLLALVRGAGADASPGVLTSIRDAAHWLVDRQNDDGSLGLPLATGRFDHPVAALALVEAAALTGDPGLHEAAAAALRHLEQQRDVLWRRGRETGQATWILAALVRADQLGWGGLGGSIERGRLALGPQAVVLLNGDFLREAPFWSLALAGNGPPRGETVDDLFTASLAVLAPELR